MAPTPAPSLPIRHFAAGRIAAEASIPSTSRVGHSHTVMLYRDGGATCECQSYSFRSPRNPDHQCKHIQVAMALACDTAPTCSPAPKPGFSPREEAAYALLTAPFATCCSCGSRYPFTDATPLYCSSACEAAATRNVAA